MNQTRKKVDGRDRDGNEKFVLCPFRNLENYKKLHRKLAEKKKVEADFMSAHTLTRARRVLFG